MELLMMYMRICLYISNPDFWYGQANGSTRGSTRGHRGLKNLPPPQKSRSVRQSWSAPAAVAFRFHSLTSRTMHCTHTSGDLIVLIHLSSRHLIFLILNTSRNPVAQYKLSSYLRLVSQVDTAASHDMETILDLMMIWW